MKTILVLLFTLLSFLQASAQKLKEFTQQKKTQKEYLLQQIAALQVYIGHVKKGYKIAKQGLDFIGDVKDGEFNLHKDYFASLKNVNPEIKKYYKVAEITALQKSILVICSSNKTAMRRSSVIREKEMDYIEAVYGRLLEDCSAAMDELIDVSTANKLELKDDERIKRIDGLHQRMQYNYTFAKGFAGEAELMVLARRQEINDIKSSRLINGIKN